MDRYIIATLLVRGITLIVTMFVDWFTSKAPSESKPPVKYMQPSRSGDLFHPHTTGSVIEEPVLPVWK